MAKGDSSGGGGYFPQLYQSTVKQTGQDYDSIMNQYKQLGQRAGGQPTTKLNYAPVSPSLTQYQPGSDYSYLKDITKTGGFSDQDVSNLRARGVSPIRSIYAGAQRNVDRQRSLQGGYSPNYGAVSAKMAREQSNLISDKMSDVNAGIAEMVQRGKLAGATSLAPLEARENELRNQINQANAQATTRANEFNAQMPLQYGQFNRAADESNFENMFKTIQGQQSLYGTTPGLANTLGGQVMQAANTVNAFPPIQRGSLSSSSSGTGGSPYSSAGYGGIYAGGDYNPRRSTWY